MTDKAQKKTTRRAAPKAKAASPNTVTSNRLKLLITVVPRAKAEYYADLLQSFDVNMQMILVAQGTADAKMLGLLGLSDTDKSVILSVIQENKTKEALSTLNEKFKTIKNGNGIACTVAFTSVIGTLIYGFLSNNRAVKEK